MIDKRVLVQNASAEEEEGEEEEEGGKARSYKKERWRGIISRKVLL